MTQTLDPVVHDVEEVEPSSDAARRPVPIARTESR